MLNDLFRNNAAQVNALLAAYDMGVINTIAQPGTRDETLRRRLTSRLSSDYSMEGDRARWAIDTWIDVIDSEVVDLWQQARLRTGPVDDSQEVNLESPLVIPCGVGNHDNGFIIKGLKNHRRRHPNESVFAVVFNYLQRRLTIDEWKDPPLFFRKFRSTVELDYRNVYRLTMIILAMLRAGYAEDNYMPVTYDGDTREIEAAIGIVNHYASLLCELSSSQYEPLLINGHGSGTSISLTRSADVWCTDYAGVPSKARVIWYSNRINYVISPSNEHILSYFLREISNFQAFRPGQISSLSRVLSADRHTVHILPTGSGKSLIFYLASLLQPNPTFVVCPTDLLIEDQLLNLDKYHRIDDACHLSHRDACDYTEFRPANKLIYLTPGTLQNTTLLKRFITLNDEKKIASIVLDEIHCISNWGHDFRPEYLMLSTYLKRHLDRVLFTGFTATADYTVVKDLCQQLDIELENVLAPVELSREQFSFKYHECRNESSMYQKFVEVISKVITDGERALVFTKNKDTSVQLKRAMGELSVEADVFDTEDPTTYHHFVNGQTAVLIASGEIGIGVNLPHVENIVHFGLPLSKGEYVQEIGRAGRNGEHVVSHVIFLARDAMTDLEHPELAYRDTSSGCIADIIKHECSTNDYLAGFRKIMGETLDRDTLTRRLAVILDQVRRIDSRGFIQVPTADLNLTAKCLYILFTIGYVFDWCVVARDEMSASIMVLVKREQQLIQNLRKKTRDYLFKMGNHKESIGRVRSATTVEAILDAYVDWYYGKFLYHHKEQFLDMADFCTLYRMSDSTARESTDKEIARRLGSYFSLAILRVSEDEAKYKNMSPEHIVKAVLESAEESTFANLERALADDYSANLDFAVLAHRVFHEHAFDATRLRRVLSNLPADRRREYYAALPPLYEQCTTPERFLLLAEVERSFGGDRDGFMGFIDDMFGRMKRDILFYGILAQNINPVFGRRSCAVNT